MMRCLCVCVREREIGRGEEEAKCERNKRMPVKSLWMLSERNKSVAFFFLIKLTPNV